MTVLLCILTLLIHAITAQFPEHVDLQKIKEVTYENEKYNILKPTVHKITDYFEEFMLRGETRKDEKIFIDTDGFRHFWRGVGHKPKSLRKTDLYEVNNNDIEALSSEDDNTEPSSEEGIEIPILRQNAKAKSSNTATKATKANAAKTIKSKDTKTTKSTVTKAIIQPKANPIQKLKSGVAKKVAITSFFCPFLGVIKMTSILD